MSESVFTAILVVSGIYTNDLFHCRLKDSVHKCLLFPERQCYAS